MICQPVTWSGYAAWPKVADAVIEAPRQRPKYAMPYVKSPPRTWRRKGNALLCIASDSACRGDPFDKPKGNWLNCVRGGRRYSLQAQGDFCGTACIAC